jgi:hypothetical protein
MKQLSSLAEVFGLDRTGADRWRTSIPADWFGWSGPHGGAVAAILTQVATDLADPGSTALVCDLRYVGRPYGGEFELRATERRVGRSGQIIDVEGVQSGRVVVSASVVLGQVRDNELGRLQARTAPDVPPLVACDPLGIAPIVAAGVHFDIRPAGGALPLTGGTEARMIAWVGLRPALPVSAAMLMIIADGLAPGIFPLLTSPVPVPTVQLGVHLHAEPAAVAPGPLLVDASNVSTSGGWSIDEADIFDTAGQLVAQARQLRRVLAPVPAETR